MPGNYMKGFRVFFYLFFPPRYLPIADIIRYISNIEIEYERILFHREIQWNGSDQFL